MNPRVLGASALGLLLAACSSLPPGVRPENYQRVQPAGTTRQQLLELLSEPTYHEFLDFDRDRYIYQLTERSSTGASWIPFSSLVGAEQSRVSGVTEASFDLRGNRVTAKSWARYEADDHGQLVLKEQR